MNYLVFNPAGTRLVTVGDDGARLWDANGHVLARLEYAGSGPMYVAKFNQAGTRIATIACGKAVPTKANQHPVFKATAMETDFPIALTRKR